MYLLLFSLVWQELRNVTNQEKKKQICFIILFSPSLACLVVSVLMLCISHLHFYPKQLTLHSIYTFYYIVSLSFIILSVHDCPWSVLHRSVCWSQTKTVHQKCNQSESCHVHILGILGSPVTSHCVCKDNRKTMMMHLNLYLIQNIHLNNRSKANFLLLCSGLTETIHPAFGCICSVTDQAGMTLSQRR